MSADADGARRLSVKLAADGESTKGTPVPCHNVFAVRFHGPRLALVEDLEAVFQLTCRDLGDAVEGALRGVQVVDDVGVVGAQLFARTLCRSPASRCQRWSFCSLGVAALKTWSRLRRRELFVYCLASVVY